MPKKRTSKTTALPPADVDKRGQADHTSAHPEMTEDSSPLQPDTKFVEAAKVTQPGRPAACTLTTREIARVDAICKVLAQVFPSFSSLDSAVADLQSDPAPYVELAFWECVAATFVAYFENAILVTVRQPEELQGLPALPEEPCEAEGSQADKGAQMHCPPGEADVLKSQRTSEGAATDTRSTPSTGAPELKQLKHIEISEEEKINLIFELASKVKRETVLKRIFILTQIPPDQLDAVFHKVKQEKEEAGAEAIRDVNILQLWADIRDQRQTHWQAAEKKVQMTLAARHQQHGSSTEVQASADGSVKS